MNYFPMFIQIMMFFFVAIGAFFSILLVWGVINELIDRRKQKALSKRIRPAPIRMALSMSPKDKEALDRDVAKGLEALERKRNYLLIRAAELIFLRLL